MIVKKVNIKKVIIALLLVILLMLCLIFGIYKFNMRSITNSKNNQVVEVTINKGMSVNSILDLLKDNNLIRNKFFTKLYIKIKKSNLQAGIYDLDTKFSSEDIIDIISSGIITNKYNVNITFQEGLNVRKIAKIIENNTNNTYDDVITLLSDRDFASRMIDEYWFLNDSILNKNIYYPLEGYLFPDTYTFENKDVSAETIIKTMLNEFSKKISSYKEEIEKSEFSLNELVTLASIAEVESLKGSDRKKVVGVSVNRINNNISLGSDMTAYYAFKVDDFKNGGLTYEQFMDCSNPYNTRCVNKLGLPIGPICNPSLDALIGAIEYEKIDALYYVSDCNGKTYFLNDYTEFHNTIERLKKENLWCEVST